MRYVFVIFFFFLNAVLLPAQKQVKNDSLKIEVRSFDNKQLQQYKSDASFQYDNLRAPVKSLWQRFWDWVWQKIEAIMSTKEGSITIWTIFILLGIALIIFFVVKVMGMRDGGLFKRRGDKALAYTTSTDDINQINFEEAIRDATDKKNYRLAIRLLYLQSLKTLSDKGLIQWKPDKTNSDYVFEVSANPAFSLFKKLTYSFEYIWYGEMNIGTDYFKNLQVQFQQFNKQLR